MDYKDNLVNLSLSEAYTDTSGALNAVTTFIKATQSNDVNHLYPL